MRISSIMHFLTMHAAANPLHRCFVTPSGSASRSGRRQPAYALMDVVLASKDASCLRHCLLACPGTRVARCLPMHGDAKVRLEICFPAGQSGAVMQQILAILPNGEIGNIRSTAAASKC